MVSNDWKNMPGYAGYEDSQTILTDTTTAIQAALTGQIGKKEEKLEEEMQEKVVIDMELPFSCVTEEFIEELSLLEPFGKETPSRYLQFEMWSF